MSNLRAIVVNRCHGGFGLSERALSAYASRKGLTLYPEKDARSGFLVTYWTVPVDARPVEPRPWHSAPIEERAAYNAAHDAATLYDKDLKRDDPDLVSVVRELGAEADGEYAKLEVVEIPADIEWQIEEYDGREWFAEQHRTW